MDKSPCARLKARVPTIESLGRRIGSGNPARSQRQARLCLALAVLALAFTAKPAAVRAETLVRGASNWQYFKGNSEPSSPRDAWREIDFNDSSWDSGISPFRYGDGQGGTVLDDMEGNYSTLYLRQAFQLDDPSAAFLQLLVDYDDALVVWINGVEVFRFGVEDESHDALSTRSHESGEAETFTLPAPGDYLVQGTNVIAVQCVNRKLDSSDLFFRADLIAGRGTETIVGPAQPWRYEPGDQEVSVPFDAWRGPDFNDSNWSLGMLPLGYGLGGEATELADMPNNYSTVFLRTEFPLTDVANVDRLDLELLYDDAILVWLNGKEFHRSENAPTPPTYDSLATSGHNANNIETFRTNDPGEFLVSGTNILAVQMFNSRIDSSDLRLEFELKARRTVGDTRFSMDRGFYEDPFDVEISTDTPGAQIRYTLDSSWPTTEDGILYDGPIDIDRTTTLRAIAFLEGLEASNVDTQTYIFLDDVVDQPRRPDGFPGSWPASSQREAVSDYEMDPEVVNDSRYRSRIKDGLRSLPVMSLVMDMDDMFGPDGVYHNGDPKANNNDEFEQPVSIELFDAEDKGFQVNGGVRPHSHIDRKRSMKLVFRKELGPGKLREKFLSSAVHHADSAIDEFDRIVLRAGHNRSWSTVFNVSDTVYTRDQWARDTNIALTGVGARGIFVHLYINGLYWGLYNPSERPDAWFNSSYFGGAKEDWFGTNHNGPISGDSSRYDAMVALGRERKLERESKYEDLQELLDLENYADYILLNFYTGNGDWPKNNWYGGSRVNPPEPFRFFAWDAEDTWDDLGSDVEGRSHDGAWVHPAFLRSASDSLVERAPTSILWRALVENEDFKVLFADRLYKHCHNGGVLTHAESKKRWDALAAHIEEAVIGESARWGDSVRSSPRTLDDHWKPERDRVRNQSMSGNVDRLISALRDEDYYPSIDPAEFSSSGGLVPEGFEVTLSVSGGNREIYYTTDHSDPREAGTGDVASDAKSYSGAITISRPTIIRSRVLRNGEWSAMSEVVFYTPQEFEPLKITEIMYHPPDVGNVDGDEFEFLEMKNTGNSTIDLSGVHFMSGIGYAAPFGLRLGAGEFLVLARNPDEFELRYPGVPLTGVFERKLSNGGETILLTDAFGAPIVEVTYGDKLPWPEDADGDGRSLVPLDPDPSDDQDDPTVWRASAEVSGSPGRDDPEARPEPDCNDNLVRDDVDVGTGTSNDLNGNLVPDECEVPPEPDCNENFFRDDLDISSDRSEDRNDNSIPDECDDPPDDDCNDNFIEDRDDVSDGTSEDRNGNDVPDECEEFPEIDCNENFIDDGEDIQSGASEDRNGTGIPDECEDAPDPDCNENFIEDVNDIALGASTDGNDNGIPDECEPAGDDCNENNVNDQIDVGLGVSEDLNLDGIPDECQETEPPSNEIRFIRADANRDGRVDVSDAITTLDFVFQGVGVLRCPDATDANDDGSVDLADPIYSINYFFVSGPAPRPPFPSEGIDPTPDPLGPCVR